MKFEAELVRGKVKKSLVDRQYHGGWFNDATTVDGAIIPGTDRLRFSSNDWGCRDQCVSAIHHFLKDFVAANPRIKFRSDNPDLHFKLTGGCTIEINKKLVRAIMGETNADFSSLANPFVFRWIVGMSRAIRNAPNVRDRLKKVSELEDIRDVIGDYLTIATFSHHDLHRWFYELMVEADARGVRLNPFIRQAWNLEIPTSYAILGLNNLRQSYLNQKGLLAENAISAKMFPPLKVKLT